MTDPVFSLPSVLEQEYTELHGRLPAEPTSNDPDERVAAIYRQIHNLPNKRTALCLSGGGIRSATFALGVLQALARLSLLKQFDYLSTVSGGGYIGSWLTAWIHRHPDGVAGVTEELRRPPSDPKNPEPEPMGGSDADIAALLDEAENIVNDAGFQLLAEEERKASRKFFRKRKKRR